MRSARSGCWGKQQFIAGLQASGFDPSGKDAPVIELVDILQGQAERKVLR
jgi:hypothetical protein